MRSLYTTTQPIAKEGWNRIVFMGMLFLLAYALSFLSWLFFILLAWTAYSYRNPERIPEEDDERALLAPIDGKVTSIAKATLNEGNEMLRIVIQKSFWDVGVLRAPMPLVVTEVKNRFGLFMDEENPLFTTLSERKVLTCKSASVVFKLAIYVGQWGHKIDFFAKSGGFKSGERLGFLNAGELVLLVPLDTRLKVVLNDSVKAGESVLGYFAYKDSNDRE
jgi:phosphatidylserine decarboxylase